MGKGSLHYETHGLNYVITDLVKSYWYFDIDIEEGNFNLDKRSDTLTLYSKHLPGSDNGNFKVLTGPRVALEKQEVSINKIRVYCPIRNFFLCTNLKVF